MGHFRKALFRLAPDPLRGRVAGHQLRMLRLQRLQLAHQRVEGGVGDLRRIEDVVLVFVMAYLFAKGFDVACSRFRHEGIIKTVAERDVPSWVA